MSLIPQDELTTLLSASEVKEVSDSAAFDQALQAIAVKINTAANTGNTDVVINSGLSEDVIEELETQGYTIKYDTDRAAPKGQVHIIWSDVDTADGGGANAGED